MKLEEVEYSLAGGNGSITSTVSAVFSRGGKIAGTGGSSKKALWNMFQNRFPNLRSSGVQLVTLHCNERDDKSYAIASLRLGQKLIRREGTDSEPIRAKAKALFRAVTAFNKTQKTQKG